MNGKTVVVTGASGFIGSHLTERLVREGARVRAYVHYRSSANLSNLEFLDRDVLRSIEIVKGDVTDPFSVKKAVQGADTVFHLAALIGIPYSYHAPQSYVNTNVIGTLNVMQAALEAGVRRVVHTSTSETYGTALYTPIDENHPLQGQSPYSASKIGADKIAESFYLSFGVPVVTLRPFNTFGPRQSARAIIPAIIAQVVSNSPSIKLGTLSTVRDFTYVEDTVHGFLRAGHAENAPGQTINLGTGKAVSIEDLLNMVLKITGKNPKVIHDETRVRPEKSEVMKLLSNPGLAKKVLDWEPTQTLEQGLRATVSFIEKNLQHYRPEEYQV